MGATRGRRRRETYSTATICLVGRLYLSERFQERWPLHAGVLKEAAASAPTIRREGRAVKRFRVLDGFLPEKPQFPRLTWGCVDAAEKEHEGPHCISSITELFRVLSAGVRPCTA